MEFKYSIKNDFVNNNRHNLNLQLDHARDLSRRHYALKD